MNQSKFYRDSRVYEKLSQPDKYCGKIKKVTTRSSWESKFIFNFLDVNSKVKAWSSEAVIIPYYSDIDGKKHRYFPDFYMKLDDSREFIIEVKPFQFLTPPKKPKRKTKSHMQLVEQYIKNTAKWEAAKGFCGRLRKETGRDISFVIVTEKEIFGLGKK